MSRYQTAYGRVRNVVVFVFPSEAEAQNLIRQIEMKNLLDKLKLPKARKFA